MATWGSGKPVIALGSDIDGIPQASQKPGVAYHDPIIEGAPGHGEGHNSGMPLNIAAALAVKKIMERSTCRARSCSGRASPRSCSAPRRTSCAPALFKDVDVCLFAHVGDNLGVSWGDGGSNGLVSVEYTFKGESAHAAGAPWRGRSALDAVELMDIGWNFRREHLRLQQRSHYVITNGGDQPNVVPPNASVWYYFRETDYDDIKELWDIGNKMAKAAAMMTDTEVSMRVLGSAWPGHFNKTVAEAMYANIEKVGLPQWSEADQTLAKALQNELKVPETGLATKLAAAPRPRIDSRRGEARRRLRRHRRHLVERADRDARATRRTSQAGPGHNWANAISMATPIAHKGVQYGAKVMAMTVLDLLMRPELVDAGVGLLQERADEGQEVHPAHSARGQAGHLAQRDRRWRSTARR